MSASCEINILTQSLEMLRDAMYELNVAQKELDHLNAIAIENDKEKKEWEAQIEIVENAPIIIKRELNGELTLKAKDENNIAALNSVKKLNQTYSRLKIINELKQKGFEKVKEVKMPNGSIRLVVQKWQ